MKLYIDHFPHFNPHLHTTWPTPESVMAFCDEVIAMADRSGTTQDITLYPLIAEPFLLRLLRRVREGVIAPEEICLEAPDGQRINITSDGDFGAPYPGGFYEWRAGELF